MPENEVVLRPPGADAGPGGRRLRAPVWLTHLGSYGLTLWVALTLNFLLPRLMPGDPISALQNTTSIMFVADDATRARLAAYYGLDQPLWVQYGQYLGHLASGNLGWSIRLHRPVSELIGARLPWTLLLMLPSLVFAAVITALAGTHAGWVRGSRTDRGLLAACTGLQILPVYFLGSLALLLFSVRLGWVPLAGATTPFRTWPTWGEQVADVGRHWVLPAGLLTLEMTGARYLLMRNSMVTVLGERYMLVARAKGLPDRALKYRHGLRNAILPFFTAVAAEFALALTGAIFIETLFAYPGLGRLVFEAVGARDYPVLEGTFLVMTLAVLTVNLLTELISRRLDPRVSAP